MNADAPLAGALRCGMIAIVGKPNVGKSTLLNALVGQKISITSRKAQTTRHRITGIRTVGQTQFVFVDTPGFQTRHSTALNRSLNKTVMGAIGDVDLVLFVVEAGKFTLEHIPFSLQQTITDTLKFLAVRAHEKDLELLKDLQAFFGCGWIRESKADRTFKYEARSVSDLHGSIIPHFERHPLRGSKASSFAAFADVCQMIEQGDHLRRDGLRQMIDIAYEMNLGKRRLARDDLLRALMR